MKNNVVLWDEQGGKMKLKKLAVAAAISMAFAVPAFANGGNNGNGCHGNCAPSGGGSTATGGTGIGIGVGIGQGGAGGQGGTGGIGVGLGGAGGQGGSANAGVVGSGNSRNTNINANRNSQYTSNRNLNAQGQSQHQGQNQAVVGSGNSRQSQGIAGSGNSHTANANNSAQAVTINQPSPDIPVSTAYAAPLTSGLMTCMGSSSGGVQGMSVGISISSTWRDVNCVALRDSKRAQEMGMNDVAVAIMCSQSVFAKAMKDAGRTCPGDAPKVAKVHQFAPVVTSKVEPVRQPKPVKLATQARDNVSVAPNGVSYVYRGGEWVAIN